MSTSESVLYANNLSYKLPQAVSVASNRVLKRNYFQNSTYTEGQSMVLQMNSGSDFVDLQNSSLVVQILLEDLNGGEVVSFGKGSAMNIVKNFRVFHRSGVSYTNTLGLNKWRVINDKWKQSQDWLDTIGYSMGYGSGQFKGGDPNQMAFFAVIPLKHVHPFFDPIGGCLLPPQMASGMRWEIDLASFDEIFVNEGAAFSGNPTFKIGQIYVQTMNVSLMDSAVASINSMASKQSLNYLYTDIFTSTNSNAIGSTAINIDINRSVAFAQEAISVIQPTASLNNVDTDEFVYPYVPCKFDYVLGSQHYPLQKVDNQELAYENGLLTFDKLKHSNKETSVTSSAFTEEQGIYSVSLERDTSLALSASPVNASRSLRLEMKLNSAPIAPQTVTVFLNYITSARTTLLSSDVSL